MRFSLRALLLFTGIIPPVAWLVYAAFYRLDPERPIQLPDALGTLAVIAWITIYYNCVHRRSPIAET
jgi:hypothetical protein